MHACGLLFSHDSLVKNEVNGELMLLISSETELFDALGVKKIGNSTRVLRLMRHLQAGRGLITMVDIEKDGDAEFPNTWSVNQVASRISQNSALNSLGSLIREHLIAGDVLQDLNIDLLLTVASPPLSVRLALKKELQALQRAVLEPKDAIALTHGLLIKIAFCSSHSETKMQAPTKSSLYVL